VAFLPPPAIAACVIADCLLPPVACSCRSFLLYCCGHCGVIGCRFCHRRLIVTLVSPPVGIAILSPLVDCCHRLILGFWYYLLCCHRHRAALCLLLQLSPQGCSYYFCQRRLIVAVGVGAGSILRFLPQVAVAAFVATGWSLPSSIVAITYFYYAVAVIVPWLVAAFVIVTHGCCCCHRQLLFFVWQLAVAAFCSQLLLLFCRRRVVS